MTDDDCLRWLDDEEQRAWRSFLRAAAAIDEALDRQLQRDAGMPHAYYQVLAMLSEAPDRTLRMSQLAEQTTSSASRLSHAVARLEEKGWVRRDKHPTDRRDPLRCSPRTAGRPCAPRRRATWPRYGRWSSTGWSGPGDPAAAISERLTDQR